MNRIEAWSLNLKLILKIEICLFDLCLCPSVCQSFGDVLLCLCCWGRRGENNCSQLLDPSGKVDNTNNDRMYINLLLTRFDETTCNILDILPGLLIIWTSKHETRITFYIFCTLPGLDQVIGPTGERVHVFLPQQRGNTPHAQTWRSGPPQRRPAGLVTARHTLSCFQTDCTTWPVGEITLKMKKNIHILMYHVSK